MSEQPQQEQIKQNNLVNVAQSLTENQTVSNEQISNVINSTQDFIERQKHQDATLSGQAVKTVTDLQEVLQAADQLNKNKNSDEKVQAIFAESAAAAKDLESSGKELQRNVDSSLNSKQIQQKASEIGEKGKEVGTSILSILKMMISGGEFRNFIDSFISTIEEMFLFNSEFGQAKIEDVDKNTLSEQQKHELSHKFLNLLRNIKQNQTLNSGVRDLLNLFSDLTDEATKNVQQDVLPQVQDALQNPHISNASKEAKNLIEEFSQRSVDPFLEKVKALFLYIRDNEKPRQWYSEFTSLLKETVETPERLDEYEFTQRVEKLVDDAFALTKEQDFKAKYSHVLSELHVIALSIKEDPDLKRLQEKTTEFLKNFTFEDVQGNIHFNTDLVQELRQLVMPLFISQLDSIVLPAIKGSNEDYDYCFDNLHFSGRDILPEMVEIHTRSDLKINLRKLEADQARSFAMLQVSKINPKFSDISFTFTRKTFPQMSDQGKANVAVTGDGVSLRIVVEMSEKEGAPSLALRRVFVDIASLNINILSSQHEFMTGLFTSLYETKIKNMIEENISNKIREIFESIQNGVNDLFARYPPSKLKAVLSQQAPEISQALL